MLHRDGDRTVTEERPASGQRLVTDHAEGIHVRGGGRLIAGGLFRRDVLGGAHHHAGLGDGGGVDGLGDAEVGDLDLPGGGDQDVAGFDVAVHQTLIVGCLQRPARLFEHVQGIGQRQSAHAGDDGVERFAVDEFHHQVGEWFAGAAVGGFAVVEDVGDARVVEHGRDLRLGAEPGSELGAIGVLGLEHLDGDPTIEPGVERFPHLSHTARGDQPHQPIAVGDGGSIR